MKKEAILHVNLEEFIYPVSRKELVIRLRTAKCDFKKCRLIYWDRTNPYNKKYAEMTCKQRDELFDYFQTKVSFSQVARYQKYFFEITDRNDKVWYYNTWSVTEDEPNDGFFEYLYANGKDVIDSPNWAKGTVYYQIFPERFKNGDIENDPTDVEPWETKPNRENYMGGDLAGIIEKIPYLKDLGVECLYLNPIFKGDFNHKYATTDYYCIDPIFGTNEVFGNLVEECHENGIRVLLDGVFNHTGVHFKQFQDVVEKKEKSEYADWFFINRYPFEITHKDYECVGAYKWMPKLNSANPEVRKFIIGVMDYWIKEYKIDGWRLDVADEVDASVWEDAGVVLREKYPEIILLGETWGYAGKMLRGNQMDSAMNYLFRDALRDYFGREIINVETFDHRINRMLSGYKEETNLLMYNLLDSHDTERFLYWCDEKEERLMLAVTFQMLFPGSPAIYYGDEVGISGGNDPDCRKCMKWKDGQNKKIFDWYKQMIVIRKEHECIRTGQYRTVLSDIKTDIYGFIRFHENEAIYVVLHKGKKKEHITCPVLEEGQYIDLLSQEQFESKNEETVGYYNGDIMEYQAGIEMDLEAYSVRVISKKIRRE